MGGCFAGCTRLLQVERLLQWCIRVHLDLVLGEEPLQHRPARQHRPREEAAHDVPLPGGACNSRLAILSTMGLRRTISGLRAPPTHGTESAHDFASRDAQSRHG